MTPRIHSALRTASLTLMVSLLSACGTTNQNLITGENQRGAYTWAQEVQLGTEADQQIQAAYGLYDAPDLQQYVERVGDAVLQTSAYTSPQTPAEVRNTPFYFRILDSPVVNAFALPGGYIYVTRGLLSHLENEAQLAVVLGHEIGHVLGRHSSEQAARQQLGQLGLIGAAVLGGVVGGGRVAEGILNYGGTGAQLLFLSYGRDAERESDRAGVAYAEFAGYDATEAVAFFETLQRLGQASGQGDIPNFLSTHPKPGERAQTIPALAAEYSPRGTVVGGPEYLSEIEGMVVGEDPRQGFVEGNTFYHPDLRFRFSFPRNWRTQNTPVAFTAAEPNGQAALRLTFAQEATAEAAARAFASQQGIQVSRSQPVSVAGYPGYRVEGTAQQQTGALGFSTTFIEYGGNVYQLLGLSPVNTFNQYVSQFRAAAESFARLSEATYLNRQPTRLQIIGVPRASTLQSFLSGRTLPPDFTAEEVAIMNQVQLTDTLPAGTSVKLPQ